MRVADTYETLVRGVSQQFPQDRRPGQMTEQVNMLPDPVIGLTRRKGSEMLAEMSLGTTAAFNESAADALNFRTMEYTAQGQDFDVLYRYKPKIPGSSLPVFIVYNKTTSQFVPLVLDPSDSAVYTLGVGGVSAITAVGKYVFACANDKVPTANSVILWNSATNRGRSVVWIRGGAYSRKFEIRVSRTGYPDVMLSHTTPTAAYPGTLNTASVPVGIPDHAGGASTQNEYIQVASYSGAPIGAPTGTQYIGTLPYFELTPSALTVRRGATTLTNVYPTTSLTPGSNQYYWDSANPQYMFFPYHIDFDDNGLGVSANYTTVKTIANPNYTKQVNDLTSAYNQAVNQWIGTSAAATQPAAIAQALYDLAVTAGLTVVRDGSHLKFTGITSVEATDSGDGTLVRTAGTVVDNIDDVTLMHDVGHVVKVTPNQGTESFYLKAVAKEEGASGFARVQWVEGTAVEHSITGGFFYGLYSAGKFYLASSASILNTLIAGDHPQINKSVAGDLDTSPLPSFVGRKVTYLGVFQDRLLVGASGVLSVSRVGDYLNFFRQTVLTLPGDDAFEMLAQGAEDDELRYGVLYDRNLIIFGKERQYVVSGKIPLTPTSANMPVMSSHKGAGDSPPITSGSLVFYSKQGESGNSLWQIMPGDSTDNPRSFSASSQLNDYISGNVIEQHALAKPSVLMIRTTEGLFTFWYTDDQNERKQDAWFKWQYATGLGTVLGIGSGDDGVVMFTVRNSPAGVWLVADKQSMATTKSSKPFLDSMRGVSIVGSIDSTTDGAMAAYGYGDNYLIGDTADKVNDLVSEYTSNGLYIGLPFEAYVMPTNPYVKDRNNKPMTLGRVTVTKFLLTVAESGPFWTKVNGVATYKPSNTIGAFSIGTETVSSRQETVPVGKETRSFNWGVYADRWFPLTITGVEWAGQYFNRATRL